MATRVNIRRHRRRPWRIAAAALEGDRSALAEAWALVSRRGDPGLARLEPALARSVNASGYGKQANERARRVLHWAIANHLIQRRALDDVAATLGRASVRWMPIKGLDTASRFFEMPEDRPASDVDVLVTAADLEAARVALRADGWISHKQDSARWTDYLRAEGYNWQATRSPGVFLEVHFRFWGLVGRRLVECVWNGAQPDLTLGSTAHRMAPAAAFVVSAVHNCIGVIPRPLLYAWELRRICGSESAVGLGREIAGIARETGLQLPVFLGAAEAASLWKDPICEEVAVSTLAELRAGERLVARRALSAGYDAVSSGAVYGARLLAGRPSRMGWKGVWRRIWGHPGVVEALTSASSPWPLRRARHILESVGAVTGRRPFD